MYQGTTAVAGDGVEGLGSRPESCHAEWDGPGGHRHRIDPVVEQEVRTGQSRVDEIRSDPLYGVVPIPAAHGGETALDALEAKGPHRSADSPTCP